MKFRAFSPFVPHGEKVLVGVLVVVAIGLAWVLIPAAPEEPEYLGRPVSYWTRHPKIPDPGLRPRVPVHYPSLDANAVPILTRALETRDGRRERVYLKVWPKLPNWSRHFFTEPVPAGVVRANAAELLGRLESDAEAAIPALVRSSKTDEDFLVRMSAVTALVKIGPGQKAVVDAVIEAGKDKDPSVRGAAALALIGIGRNEARVPDALLGALNDKDPTVRASALKAWHEIYPYQNPGTGNK